MKRFKDFEFQPVKARKADLTDTGPGVATAVSNTDVKCRDAELAGNNTEFRLPYKMSQREVTVGRMRLNKQIQQLEKP